MDILSKFNAGSVSPDNLINFIGGGIIIVATVAGLFGLYKVIEWQSARPIKN